MNNRVQKISENLLVVTFRYWLPLGTVDPMMLSYLLSVAISLCNKWKVIGGGKIMNMVNSVRIHTNVYLNE